MAVTPTITRLADDNAIKVEWNLTTADPIGVAMDHRFLAYPKRTVYFLGTWGGATAKLQGGDGVTFVSLNDPQGSELSATADTTNEVQEAPEYTRPQLTTVGVGADIVVTVIARK